MLKKLSLFLVFAVQLVAIGFPKLAFATNYNEFVFVALPVSDYQVSNAGDYYIYLRSEYQQSSATYATAWLSMFPGNSTSVDLCKLVL